MHISYFTKPSAKPSTKPSAKPSAKRISSPVVFEPHTSVELGGQYGFFCDIEESPEIVRHDTVNQPVNHTVNQPVNHNIYEVRRPIMSPLPIRHNAQANAAVQSPAVKFKKCAAGKMSEIYGQFRRAFYSGLIIYVLIISVYISIYMPLV